MTLAVGLCRIDDVLKRLVGPNFASSTLADCCGSFFGIEYQILHPDHQEWIICVLIVLCIPIIPQVGQTVVLVFSLVGILHRQLVKVSIFRNQIWAIIFPAMIPPGSVTILTHAFEPSIWVSEGR